MNKSVSMSIQRLREGNLRGISPLDSTLESAKICDSK